LLINHDRNTNARLIDPSQLCSVQTEQLYIYATYDT
jgi:hypothetical protein